MKLINDDCLNTIKTLEDNSIDICLTDPPYGINFQSNRSKNGPIHKKITGDNKVDGKFLFELFPKIKQGGVVFLFCDWKTSHSWENFIKDSGFNIKSHLIWNRLHHGMGDLTGSFAPMHDIIWYATKGRRVFEGGRPKSIKEHKRPSPSQNFDHPTCKPVPLLVELIRDVLNISDKTIIDPFMGSGSTGVAAKEVGLNFIGIEIDSDYFKMAESRINENNT